MRARHPAPRTNAADLRPVPGRFAFPTLLAAALLATLAVPALADWQASGRFFYRDREQDLNGFTGVEVDLPARRVDLQVLDANTSQVLASGATDATGSYSLNVVDAQVRDVRVRFLSSSDQTAGLFFEVLNNTSQRQVYTVVSSIVGSHDPNTDVNFGDLTTLPGAGGEAFNCYDVILNGQDFVQLLDGSWPLVGLVVYWQTGSTDGTFFRSSDNSIHLTGDEGYDDTVVAHEHGHFVSRNFSKDNSPGGQHFLGDNNQDIRLSWSEGYATYWGNSARRRMGVTNPDWTHYIDTSGLPGPGNLDFSYEIEGPSISAVGAASEVTVQALLWDVVDDPSTADMTPGFDDDPVVDRSDENVWEVTRNYLPMGSVANVSMEDFWDGWFRPGPGHDRLTEMTAAFDALTVEFHDDAFEDDDLVSTSVPIAADGSPQHHTFYPSGDFDHAWFPAGSGESFIVETTDLFSDANTNLAILDSTGAVLAINDNRSGSDASSRIAFTAPHTGRFFPRVNHSPDLGVYGSYNLRVHRGTSSSIPFSNAAASTGTNNSGNSRGVAWADVNDDGWLDLYVTNVNSSNALYLNNNGLNFSNVAGSAGVALNTSSEGACFGDYDNDGDKDLYVVTVGNDDRLYQNRWVEEALIKFVDVTASVGITDSASGRTANWVDVNRDGFLDLFVSNVETGPSKLWLNDQVGGFIDATFTSGLVVLGAISSSWADADGDGDDDVFVGVNAGSSRMFRNDDGSFVDVTGTANTVAGTATFAVDWGDYDGDGDFDVTVADAGAPNFLYRNQGGFLFDDVSVTANAASPFLAVGSTFLDHDLDGDLDIFVANFNDPTQFYDNVTGTAFTVTGSGAFTTQARTAAHADYDHDGDLDVYVASQITNLMLNNGAPARPWLQVDLIGRTSNRDGIGSRLRAIEAGARQHRHVYAGHGFGCQNSARVEFGFPPGTLAVDTLIVDWPSGKRSVLTEVPVDTVLVVDEAGAIAVEDGPGARPALALAAPWPNPAAGAVALAFAVPADLAGAPARLEIFDVSGRRVATLLEGTLAPGPQRVRWDLTVEGGARARAGVYFAQLRVGAQSQVRKLVVVSAGGASR